MADDAAAVTSADTDSVESHASLSDRPSPPQSDLPSSGSSASLGLSHGDVRFAAICGGVILLLLLAHWGRHAWFGPQLVEIDRLPAKAYQFTIEINSATWVEWMQLEGIGDVLAHRIVADRDEHGPFASIEDVQRVPGIGSKTLNAIRPQLLCSDCPESGKSP